MGDHLVLVGHSPWLNPDRQEGDLTRQRKLASTPSCGRRFTPDIHPITNYAPAAYNTVPIVPTRVGAYRFFQSSGAGPAPVPAEGEAGGEDYKLSLRRRDRRDLANPADSMWSGLGLAGGRLIDFQRRTSGLGLAWGAEGGLVFGEALDFGLHELQAGLFGRQFGFVWFC